MHGPNLGFYANCTHDGRRQLSRTRTRACFNLSDPSRSGRCSTCRSSYSLSCTPLRSAFFGLYAWHCSYAPAGSRRSPYRSSEHCAALGSRVCPSCGSSRFWSRYSSGLHAYRLHGVWLSGWLAPIRGSTSRTIASYSLSRSSTGQRVRSALPYLNPRWLIFKDGHPSCNYSGAYPLGLPGRPYLSDNSRAY